MNFNILNNFSLFKNSSEQPNKKLLTEAECVSQGINWDVYSKELDVKNNAGNIIESLESLQEFVMNDQKDNETLRDLYARYKMDLNHQFEDLKDLGAIPGKVENLEILDMTKNDVAETIHILLEAL